MIKFKSIFLLLSAIFVLLIISGCGDNTSSNVSNETENSSTNDSGEATSDESFTIKIGHVLGEDYHYSKGALKFKELIEEGTDSNVTVELYANAQLGNGRDMLEGLQLGTQEMGIFASGDLAGFVPEFALLDLGYLFESSEVAMEVLNGSIGDTLNTKMIDVGFRNLAFIDAGFRNIYASKPIKSVEDLGGLVIRTLPTPAHIDLFNALGASPNQMGYSEIYTGLQQGVLDAAENVPEAYYDSKHYEVANEYTKTNHVYLTVMYVISEQFYQELPEEYREVVQSAAQEAAEYHNGLIKDIQAEAFSLLEEEGVNITQISDITPFVEDAKESWESTVSEIDGGQALLEEILEQTGQ